MLKKVFLTVDAFFIFLLLVVGVDYSSYLANIKYVSDTKTVILNDVINLNIEDKNINLNNLEYDKEIEKSFVVENLSDQDEKFNILFSDITNDFVNELVYELYEGEKLVVSQTIAPKTSDDGYIKLNIALKGAEKKQYNLKMKLINKNGQPIESYSEKKFNARLEINSLIINTEIKTATNYLLANNNIASEDETDGFFKTNETNNGMSTYYFKGYVSNNYVNFNEELYRIVRINEDGSIRIIRENGLDGTYTFNDDKVLENANDYMNSNVKNVLDSYYENTLKSYDSMLINENYCYNDTIVTLENYKTSEEDKTYQEYTPSFKCQDNKLKIGLLTYSEVVMAGINYNTRVQNYLNNSFNTTWLMNKAGESSRTHEKKAWYLDTQLRESNVAMNTISIRPVINLKGTLNVIGNGTIDNPYIFSE